jgi:indole-3-glycerol phosphate synthase
MKRTHTILDEIVADKKKYLMKQKLKVTQSELDQQRREMPIYDGPGFFDVLKANSPRPKLIAEVKKASPSGGVLRQSFSLEAINEDYQSASNVVAISVITESAHFAGNDESLAFFARHNHNKKPLLQKDFIFDPYQILESKILGAQAYLLIASLFSKNELEDLVAAGIEIGLEPIVEVHDEQELAMAQGTKARIIGVNARDLKTFEINIELHGLLEQLDDSYARIAESGVNSAQYISEVSSYADAVLVGSYLMSQSDIPKAIASLVNQPTGRS